MHKIEKKNTEANKIFYSVQEKDMKAKKLKTFAKLTCLYMLNFNNYL